MKALSHLWMGVSGIYLLALAALAVAALLAHRTEARGLFASALSILSFLALALLPVGLLLGQWRLALPLTLPIAVLALAYGPLLLPRGASTSAAPPFSVLTFNIETGEHQPDRLARVIRESNADIVAVQELGQTAADYFRDHLNDLYPYQSLYPQANPYAGQGLLSRYPIVDDEYWRNLDINDPYGHLRAELDVRGVSLTLFSTHPVPPISFEEGVKIQAHGSAIDRVLSRARAHSGPVILVGDFNMTDHFDEYQTITRQGYTDAFRAVGEVGFGFTFPTPTRLLLPPVIRLDYIFYNDQVRGITARVWPDSGESDHHPVYAELVLAPRRS